MCGSWAIWRPQIGWRSQNIWGRKVDEVPRGHGLSRCHEVVRLARCHQVMALGRCYEVIGHASIASLSGSQCVSNSFLVSRAISRTLSWSRELFVKSLLVARAVSLTTPWCIDLFREFPFWFCSPISQTPFFVLASCFATPFFSLASYFANSVLVLQSPVWPWYWFYSSFDIYLTSTCFKGRKQKRKKYPMFVIFLFFVRKLFSSLFRISGNNKGPTRRASLLRCFSLSHVLVNNMRKTSF